MMKIITIAAREYNAVIRSKAFVISIILLPVMMFGSVMIGKFTEHMRDDSRRAFAVIDHTPGAMVLMQLTSALQQDVELRSRFWIESVSGDKSQPDQQRLDLSERVRRGDLAGILEIGQNVLTAAALENVEDLPDEDVVGYRTNSPTAIGFRDWASREINRYVQGRRFAELHLPAERVRELQSHVAVLSRGLARKDAAGSIVYSEASRDNASFLIPFGLVFLMFIVVVIGAVPMLQGIVEEKQQRIAEVLLGSVSPFQLMAGKVIGIVATSFTMILIYLGGAYWAAHRMNMAEYLSAGTIAWFLVFQLLAVLMYGSLYIAIGAACTDSKEMQSLLMPVNLLMAIPLMLILPILMSPRGTLARMITWFPPATPFVSVARIAIPPGMSLLETGLAIVVVSITTIVLIWASGRIFRVGILMQGKGANLAQIVKWVFKG